MTAPFSLIRTSFIDAADSEDKAKQRAAQNWRTVLWQGRVGRTSFQVLQEFYAKATYRWPTARDQARQEVNDLLACRPVVASGDLFASSWKIQDRFRFILGLTDRRGSKAGQVQLSPHGRSSIRAGSRWTLSGESVRDNSGSDGNSRLAPRIVAVSP